MSTLQQFTADHRYLRDIVARQAALVDPVLVDASDLRDPLVAAARPLETLAIDGVLMKSWDRQHRQAADEVVLGARSYEIQGIRFVVVMFDYSTYLTTMSNEFIAVAQQDYERLRTLAQRLNINPQHQPILAAGQAQVLWENTIEYLLPANLERIQRYGGRPHRGILLSGSPGNGKTMACRWICDECRDRGWEWRLVTPDTLRQARYDHEVDKLFRMADRGVIFFDDMDQALRDRKYESNIEEQSVFLTALDGMQSKQGVVFVFTTNCTLDQIDRAFKRPGRIDVVLHFKEPDAEMRRRLLATWHADIREHLDESMLIASTDGYSFADLEEIKNLLVMRFVDRGVWDWSGAVEQFTANRTEAASRRTPIGFQKQGANC